MNYLQYNDKLRRFGSGLATLAPGKVFHYTRPASGEMNGAVVWAEDAEEQPAGADNGVVEMQMHGVIDYWTSKEYDDMITAILGYLACYSGGIVEYSYTAVMYEDELKLIHHSFDFWLS